jgi:hypothetical protein
MRRAGHRVGHHVHLEARCLDDLLRVDHLALVVHAATRRARRGRERHVTLPERAAFAAHTQGRPSPPRPTLRDRGRPDARMLPRGPAPPAHEPRPHLYSSSLSPVSLGRTKRTDTLSTLASVTLARRMPSCRGARGGRGKRGAAVACGHDQARRGRSAGGVLLRRGTPRLQTRVALAARGRVVCTPRSLRPPSTSMPSKKPT